MITPQQLADAFIAAGLDTPEKVVAVLNRLGKNLDLGRIDAALADLAKQRDTLIAPIDNKRLVLQAERKVLMAELAPEPEPIVR